MSAYLSCQPQALALLQEAKGRPEEDVPRLALADWLDVRGDPARAEFIRLQICLAPGTAIAAYDHKAVHRRSRELLARHGGTWLGSLWSFRLPVVSWHRGLLSVGLSHPITVDGIADVVPWIDTILFQVSSRQPLQHVPQLLARTCLNHAGFDLRTSHREGRLLDMLALLPENACLRTLSWWWPFGMLRKHDQAKTTPAVSDGFLSTLLRDLPVTRRLTHLASSPPWTIEQEDLIRFHGVEPLWADEQLWMHSLFVSRFQGRDSKA